jgi:hypothetical protein
MGPRLTNREGGPRVAVGGMHATRDAVVCAVRRRPVSQPLAAYYVAWGESRLGVRLAHGPTYEVRTRT